MTATRFAIIADPHFHDVAGNYRNGRVEASDLPAGLELRTLADTVQSTRLFNESGPALRAVLDDIAARGIRDVVITGDYSDDGQDESVAGVTALLRDYSEQRGMRFYSTVGNHDVYGYTGRSLDRDFLLKDGASFCVSGTTEDPARRIFHNPAMRCRAYQESLPRDLGFFRRGGELHWETPFGASDDLADRQYEVRSPGGQTQRFIDASYLVEPVPGVWLLSIDANVFAPRDGESFSPPEEAFEDSTNAGHNALVKHRPYVVDWIADVVRRAARAGKRLIAFSHYPMVDPFDGTHEDEKALTGDTIFLRRTPTAATSALLEATGLGIHFSGHLHIDHLAVHGGLVNVAVPSTAGYPAGYRLLTLTPDGAELESIRVGGISLNRDVISAYAREVERSGLQVDGLLASEDYDGFMLRHLKGVARHRFVAKEWPQDLQRRVGALTLADLAGEVWAGSLGQRFTAAEMDAMAALPAMDFACDLYVARHDASWRHEMTDAGRRALYEKLCAQDIAGNDASEAARLLRIFKKHFLKDDIRKLVFSKDWRLLSAGGDREAA